MCVCSINSSVRNSEETPPGFSSKAPSLCMCCNYLTPGRKCAAPSKILMSYCNHRVREASALCADAEPELLTRLSLMMQLLLLLFFLFSLLSCLSLDFFFCCFVSMYVNVDLSVRRFVPPVRCLFRLSCSQKNVTKYLQKIRLLLLYKVSFLLVNMYKTYLVVCKFHIYCSHHVVTQTTSITLYFKLCIINNKHVNM